MVAKSEPFFNLLEQLVHSLVDLAERSYRRNKHHYSGELANFDVRPLTNNAVKGVSNT